MTVTLRLAKKLSALALLCLASTTPPACAARVPLRPVHAAAAKHTQAPLNLRRRTPQAVTRPAKANRRQVRQDVPAKSSAKASERGSAKSSAKASPKHSSRSHPKSGNAAPSKALPRSKTRRKKPVEPDDDSGIEFKRAKGRTPSSKQRSGPARGLALIGQPRWRVHEVPPPPANSRNLAALLPRTPVITAPVTPAVPAPADLSASQQAALEQELQQAADSTPRDTSAATPAEDLLHPTRTQLAADAVLPTVLPGSYRDGRMIVGPLRGSREVLVHQNLMADDAGLERIRNDAQLARLRAAHKLVDFTEGNGLAMNPPLPRNRRCARPWTVHFAADIARAYSARFGDPLVVTSAVRTIGYQLRLQRVNGNAAAIDGDGASPHLTGQALDFGKRGMSSEQLTWMRSFLLPLMQAGKIDVEEEFQQACFHISVYRSYAPVTAKTRRTELAQVRSLPAAGLP